MQNSYAYPLDIQFKVVAFSNQFICTDANGQTVAYVKQKAFKFKEEVNVFSDASCKDVLFQINANKWLDFSASYRFTDKKSGLDIGSVRRKGLRSIFKAKYEIFDERDTQDLLIEEESAWVRVLDALFKEIPLVGMFSGYVFNPAYTVKRPDGTLVVKFKKMPSFFGRKFRAEKVADFDAGEENRVLLGLIMMVLLERFRG